MIELKDTIEDMLSEDYIDRFKEEYKQLITRLNNLKKYIAHYKPKIKTIKLYLLEEQLIAMTKYKNTLELRASLENIDLNEGTNLD